MSVRVGKVEIKAVQTLRTVEARSIAAARVPGHAGGVHQDLGRDPVRLDLEGILYDKSALQDVETLREAHTKAKPQSFAADIAVGTDITDVIVEDVRFEQIAGSVNRFQCALRLREFTPPPEKPGAGLAAVAGGIMKDAGRWMEAAKIVMAAIKDPKSLLDNLMKHPELLELIGADELANAVMDQLSEWGGEDIASLINTIRKIDPEKAIKFVNACATAKNFDDFLKKGGAALGADVLREVGVDIPPEYVELAEAAASGGDLLRKLEEFLTSTTRLAGDLASLKLKLPTASGGAS